MSVIQQETSQATEPVLRWAGGKRWLAPYLYDVVSAQSRYIEPFLGGGSVFFHAQPEKSILSDGNASLIQTYIAIRDAPEAVLNLLRRWRNDETTYYAVRSLEPGCPVESAAQFVYLNRTCWNGLYRVNRSGKFNVPYGNNPDRRVVDHDNFLQASLALQTADLKSSDFAEPIAEAASGDCVYLDPPYTDRHGSTFNRYTSSVFTWEDQGRLARLAAAAVKRGAWVIVSNSVSSAIRCLYPNFGMIQITRKQLVAGVAAYRGSRTEAVFVSQNVDRQLLAALEHHLS